LQDIKKKTKTGIRNTLKNSEKIILQLEKYHSDKTVLLFQNWHNCWLSKSFNNWNIEKKLIKIKCPSLILVKRQYATQEHCTEIAKKSAPLRCPLLLRTADTFHTRKIPVLYHKQSTFFKKDHEKYSYTSGISDEPLLGLTIGEAFEETVSRFPKNDVVSKHQNIRYTYEQLEIE
jgi:hypothetical protein